MAKGERLAAQAARDAVRAERPPERHVYKKPPERECLNCGKPFEVPTGGAGGHKTFCKTMCRTSYLARCGARGKTLLPYAMAWRVGRNSKKIKDSEIFREVIAILDAFVDADRQEGRPMPTGYVERTLARGYNYKDRKRG